MPTRSTEFSGAILCRAATTLVLLFVLLCMLISFRAPAYGQELKPNQVYVETKTAQVRANPAHWAPAVQQLVYGDSVVETGRNSGWLHVALPDGREGYLHESAVTLKRVVLRETGGVGAVDASDIVLAGKGFSGEVEASYAGSENLNYEPVDKIESYKIAAKDLEEFLKQGELDATIP